MENRKKTYTLALGGVLAALAIVIMCMGTLIPVATFVCPMLCILLAKAVLQQCGSRLALAWYCAVSLLSLLLAPDKEAAAVFAALGYYPVVKQKVDILPLRWLWKGALFNAVILLLYWMLMNLFGLSYLVYEFSQMGTAMTLLTLALGNVCFFLLDRLLGMRLRFRR